jgi:hypothetical protein
VSVRDELFLDLIEAELQIQEQIVWTLWPKLRRPALNNADSGTVDFWHSVARMPKLEKLVLTRADRLEEICAKTEYFRHTDRAINVLLVNISSRQPQQMPRSRWDKIDPTYRMRIMTYDVPTSYYGDEDEIDLCQGWVMSGARRGTLVSSFSCYSFHFLVQS